MIIRPRVRSCEICEISLLQKSQTHRWETTKAGDQQETLPVLGKKENYSNDARQKQSTAGGVRLEVGGWG